MLYFRIEETNNNKKKKKQTRLFIYLRYFSCSSCNNLADDLASKNKSLHSSISSLLIFSLPFIFANILAGVNNCTAYLKKINIH